MGSDDRDSAVYAPFDAIKRHYGYLHRIKDIGEALQLAPKVNIYDLAVDGSGNVYVIQQPPGSGSPATVYKIRPLAGGSYAAPLVIATGPTADAIAVDGAGVVYLPDDSSTNATVYTLTPNATGTTYTQSSFDVTGLA